MVEFWLGMKKIFLVLAVFISLFLTSTKYILAGCTQVGSNQTTCSGTQSVPCSQSLPTPGRIDRYCCDTQTDCDATKATIQEGISEKLAKPGDNSPFGKCGDKAIDTAIGCISVLDTPENFLGDILKWAVGVGGGIAFLLIVYASFMIMTSAGNPERLKAGQELLTSAISGLILLIFSVFILKFIGVDILGLDKFGFNQSQ